MEKINGDLNRMVTSNIPVIAVGQKLALLWEQKIEVLRHDFIRQRFVPTAKQKEFMSLGSRFRRRAIFAGNRCGKTVGGCAELVYHLTGQYPDWWDGKRFDRPINAWASSTTKEKTINGIQTMLMGKSDGIGTGFIPWARVVKTDRMMNVPSGIAKATIRHGDLYENESSILTFKSYEQGRKAFETERVDYILLDEEPPYDIYRECQMRTIGSDRDPGGLIALTFTPLEGMTDVCLSFLEPHNHAVDMEGFEDIASQTVYLMASWEDNPHLSKAEIAELIKDTPPHELEARRFGRPSLGAGKIYKIPEERFTVEPFAIPKSWLRGLSLDHGWDHPSAVCSWARDPNSGVCYLIATWRQSETLIPDIASILRRHGAPDVPAWADPSGQAERQDAGGKSTFEQYADEGIDLFAADNQIQSGLEDVRFGLMSGELKVFGYEGGVGPCMEFYDEYRLYRKNEKGNIVKVRDDVMDATRYGYRHRDEWAVPRSRFSFDSFEAEDWRAS